MANVLGKEKQAVVIGALAEGNSIRAIERLPGMTVSELEIFNCVKSA